MATYDQFVTGVNITRLTEASIAIPRGVIYPILSRLVNQATEENITLKEVTTALKNSLNCLVRDYALESLDLGLEQNGSNIVLNLKYEALENLYVDRILLEFQTTPNIRDIFFQRALLQAIYGESRDFFVNLREALPLPPSEEITFARKLLNEALNNSLIRGVRMILERNLLSAYDFVFRETSHQNNTSINPEYPPLYENAGIVLLGSFKDSQIFLDFNRNYRGLYKFARVEASHVQRSISADMLKKNNFQLIIIDKYSPRFNEDILAAAVIGIQTLIIDEKSIQNDEFEQLRTRINREIQFRTLQSNEWFSRRITEADPIMHRYPVGYFNWSGHIVYTLDSNEFEQDAMEKILSFRKRFEFNIRPLNNDNSSLDLICEGLNRFLHEEILMMPDIFRLCTEYLVLNHPGQLFFFEVTNVNNFQIKMLNDSLQSIGALEINIL